MLYLDQILFGTSMGTTSWNPLGLQYMAQMMASPEECCGLKLDPATTTPKYLPDIWETVQLYIMYDFT